MSNYEGMVEVHEGREVDGREGLLLTGALTDRTIHWIKNNVPSNDHRRTPYWHGIWVHHLHRQDLIELLKEEYDTIIVRSESGKERYIDSTGSHQQDSLF